MIAFRAPPNRETEEELMLRVPRRAVVSVLTSTALLLSGATAAAETFVVAAAAGPGVDFTLVQAAVDASSDGDVLLIFGAQNDVSLDVPNKSLTLTGLSGPGDELPNLRTMTIHDLAASKSLVVRHLV